MPLKFESESNIRAKIDLSMMDITKIMENSRFVKEIKLRDHDSYDLTIYWNTYDFITVVKEFKNANSYIIETTDDSKYHLKVSISSVGESDGTEINSRLIIIAQIDLEFNGNQDLKNSILISFEDFVKKNAISAIKKYAIDSNIFNITVTYDNYKNLNKMLALEQFLPITLVGKILFKKWREANDEITTLLAKNMDNMYYWLAKAYVAEKLNSIETAKNYINYINNKDKNIFNRELALLLYEDSDLIKEPRLLGK